MPKSLIVASLCFATALAAQTPAPTPAPPLLPPSAVPVAPVHSELPVDRIVAVVGDHPILWSDVQEMMIEKQRQGVQIPADAASQADFARKLVNDLVDEELLVQTAKSLKVEVGDEDVASGVDQQIKKVRDQFKTEAEYREAMKQNGFGTPDEYRKWLMDQATRSALYQRVIDKMRQDGKLPPAPVSESDVTEAFEKNKATLPKRPATITFRQIVITPRASAASKAVARAHAESLLVEIRKGGDFEQIAKRESADESNKDLGGDLGWNRRGKMVPEFDRVMFALAPGQVSGVVETTFGYHIIRVDRVQPAEVKARHILIRPKVDSSDVASARAEADSVRSAWLAGGSFDSLAAKHHDPDEEKGSLTPFPREQLPPSYATALEGKTANEITEPFPIEDKRRNVPKFVIVQLLTSTEGGEYTVADLRGTIREQLAQERSFRRLLDSLRKGAYVDVRLDSVLADANRLQQP
jgi:peptidyl-prolyl cis-trans isomerase SurA